jgi:aminocarboxymuconate-semialdehyde decarboxylase
MQPKPCGHGGLHDGGHSLEQGVNRRDVLRWGNLALALGTSLAALRGGTEARAQGSGGGAVDVHAHFYPEAFLKLIAQSGGPPGFTVRADGKAGYEVLVRSMPQGLDATYWDLDQRLKRMDSQGVTTHLLSLTAPMVHWAPAEQGAALARAFNDAVIQAHTAFPGRFYGAAALPLQDPALALTELNRVGGQKAIRGVYLPTNVAPRDVGDPAFNPIYARAEELGLPVLLHPVNVLGMDRLGQYYLGNLLGNPFDSTVAAAHLIFGGVLDRYPKLEVVLPHGGGTLPYLWGRIEHGQQVRVEAKGKAQKPVHEYLRRFHYDTIVHSPQILRYLVSLVGADRVMLGSDYCFDMGYAQPREVIATSGFSTAEADLLYEGNAARLLKI